MQTHLRAPRRSWTWPPALVVPPFIMLGWSFDTTDSADAVLGSVPRTLLFIIVWGFASFLLHFILDKLYRAIDAYRSRELNSGQVLPMGDALKKWFLWALLPFLVTWMAWWFIHFPGALDDDTLTEMLQSSGLQDWSDHHPVFDTWLFGRVWALGDAIGSRTIALGAFTGLQTILTAASMALLFVYIRRLGAPSKLVTVLQVLFTATPLIPMYAMSMTKDYLHAWILVLFSLLFTELVRTRGRLLSQPSAIVAFCILGVLLALTKKTGLYTLLFCFVIALVICKSVRRRTAITLGLPILAVILFSSIGFHLLGINSGSRGELLSIPFQQTARVLRDDSQDVSTDEKDTIDKVLADNIDELYNPRRADAVKNTWNQSASRTEKLDYIKVWFSLGLRHPDTYTWAFINMTYDYLYPVPLDDLYDEVSPHLFTEDWIDYLYSQTKPGTDRSSVAQIMSGIQASDALSVPRELVNNVWKSIRHTPVIGILFTGAPYVGWIPLFSVFYLLRTRNTVALAAMTPAITVILTLCIGPIALPRYISSAIYLSPLVLSLPFLHAPVNLHFRQSD